MRAERTTATPTISIAVAMSTSASEKPCSPRNPWRRPLSVFIGKASSATGEPSPIQA